MTAATSARPRLPVWVALCGAALIGVLTALQARVNGQLGIRLHDGFVAAVISFGSGLAILIVLTLVLPVGRRGFTTLVTGVRARTIPWWMLVAGAAGAFTVATQSIAVGVIGVSLFTVGFVAGQIVFGLVLDRIGFGPAGVVAVTIPRLVGAALALAAVAVSLSGGATREAPLWMLILPLVAGMGVAWQQATNGRLRAAVGTPLTATLMNFVNGTVVLAVAAAVHVTAAGPPAALPADWWMYLGGALGVAYIFMSAALVAFTGVLLLALGTVVGQLAASVVLDALWPATASPGFGQEALTASIALVAVLAAAIPWRRMRPADPRPR